MHKPSRIVRSSQQGPHAGLTELLQRHQRRPYARRIASHNRRVFSQLRDLVGDSPKKLILDAGCGSGESTRILSRRFPEHTVIGVDKSAHRLGMRESGIDLLQQGRLILVRADLIDFWRLAAEHDWNLAGHFLLYPNPWPKPGHLQRRWHGHPVFETLVRLGGLLELRGNWKIYLQEFALALELVTGLVAEVQNIQPDEFLSPFERKYASSGHTLYRMSMDLDGLARV